MRKLNTNEKMMIALIVVMTIGVIVRWGFIKGELKQTVNIYKERISPTVPTDTTASDSTHTDTLHSRP